jgi:predicted enzyme related to lactoylglutathione lyase
MLNFSSVLIGTHQVEVMADFYRNVFDKKEDMSDGGYHGWLVGSGFFSIGKHSEIKGHSKEPQRVLFNFETSDVKEEFDRISKIEGAKVIKEPYQMEGWDGWIATLADPDGNYFQLMTPWEDEENKAN